MNNKYTIRVTDPLLRPGLEIETEASEGYVCEVVDDLMKKVREINGDGRGREVDTEYDFYPEAVDAYTVQTAYDDLNVVGDFQEGPCHISLDCPACGERHVDLLFNPVDPEKIQEFTHGAICSTTGELILLELL